MPRRPSYELLPLASDAPKHTRCCCLLGLPCCAGRRLSWLRRPLKTYLTYLVAFGAAFTLATTLLYHHYPLPPLYSRFHQAELALPQHDIALPLPDGRNAQFLWIANHAKKCGWGNAMQELFLNAYLAYRSGRGFVFDNYTWSHEPGDYSLYNLKPIPSRIPLTAMIRGPIVGGPFPPSYDLPRAVTPEYFNQACHDRTVIADYQGIHRGASAETMIQDWLQKLGATRCVEIPRGLPEVFNEQLFADADRLLDIWPQFSQSPIVQAFSWSTLVELAFDTNRHIIAPTALMEPTLSSYNTSGLARYTPIPGLLVLHIRRGDFKTHCTDVLAARSIGYTGFNSFHSLPDRWHLPGDTSERDKRALYMRHCFPDIPAIVRRVEEVRAADEAQPAGGSRLRQVYIMTNGAPSWVARLKRALLEKHEWEHIASSRELVLTPEQKGVSQTIDMLAAQRAQVFVGNGFSTLSGMVVMLRMASGLDPQSTRHW